MQLVHCTVNLAGDPRFQAKRSFVSVPELLVLKAIHGEDAIVAPVYAGERSDVDEYDALMTFYGKKEEIKDKIEKIFPGGERAVLPQTLDAIGLAEIATPELVDAFEVSASKARQDELEQARRVKASRTRRTAALAEADEASEEEAELIRPPKINTSKKRTTSALMG